jgi:hypothetical protein
VRNVSGTGRGFVARKTNKKQGVLALHRRGKIADPIIKVEPGVASLAAGVVVELDEQGIKAGIANDIVHLEPFLAQRALRRARDEHSGVAAANLLDHKHPRLLVGCVPY